MSQFSRESFVSNVRLLILPFLTKMGILSYISVVLPILWKALIRARHTFLQEVLPSILCIYLKVEKCMFTDMGTVMT